MTRVSAVQRESHHPLTLIVHRLRVDGHDPGPGVQQGDGFAWVNVF